MHLSCGARSRMLWGYELCSLERLRASGGHAGHLWLASTTSLRLERITSGQPASGGTPRRTRAGTGVSIPLPHTPPSDDFCIPVSCFRGSEVEEAGFRPPETELSEPPML